MSLQKIKAFKDMNFLFNEESSKFFPLYSRTWLKINELIRKQFLSSSGSNYPFNRPDFVFVEPRVIDSVLG